MRESLIVSDHAIDRYIERVRPNISRLMAKADLVDLSNKSIRGNYCSIDHYAIKEDVKMIVVDGMIRTVMRM